jgi:hypothetical protein
MTPSEVLRELHESIQRQKRLLNRLRLLEAIRIGELADKITDEQWRELDANADD